MRFTEPRWAVYVCAGPVDFRKGMASLAVLVESQLQLAPFAEALFVFTNRNRRAIKILYWQRNGFCLYPKGINGKNALNKTVSYGRKPMRWEWSRCPPNNRIGCWRATASAG